MQSFTWTMDMVVDKYTNIEFEENINIIWLTGDAYLEIDWEIAFESVREKLEEDIFLEVPKWTNLYSPDEDIEVEYHIVDSTDIKTLTIKARETIQLEEDVRITWVTWELYLETDWKTRLVWQEMVDYIWKPILPWAKIKLLKDNEKEPNYTESSHIDIKYYDNSEIQLDLREIESYELYELPSSTSSYSIRTNIPNDFYYARIIPFQDDIYGTPSKQILLSPQKEADKTPPEWDFKGSISIPINRIKEYDFTNYIYENSWIANIEDLYIDFDLEVDSDGDWDPANDNDNEENNIKPILTFNKEPTWDLEGSSWILEEPTWDLEEGSWSLEEGSWSLEKGSWSIISEAEKVAIEFWPYEEVDKRKIRIMAVDNNNNIWFWEFDFEVYSSDLSITSINNNNIEWAIEEPLWIESIWFYRIRSWKEERLKTASGSDLVLSDEEWKFEFDVWNTASGLVLTNSWTETEIAKINEHTGKIELYKNEASIKVDTSNSIYPQVSINYWWNNIFTEYMVLSEDYSINYVNDFEDVSEDWIYVELKDKINYNYYQLPDWIPYNPWAFVIYDSSDDYKEPLFTIFRDGGLSLDDSKLKIGYGYYGDYMVYVLYNSSDDSEVARVMMRVRGNYLVEGE